MKTVAAIFNHCIFAQSILLEKQARIVVLQEWRPRKRPYFAACWINYNPASIRAGNERNYTAPILFGNSKFTKSVLLCNFNGLFNGIFIFRPTKWKVVKKILGIMGQ
jgi:hypothetical protein